MRFSIQLVPLHRGTPDDATAPSSSSTSADDGDVKSNTSEPGDADEPTFGQKFSETFWDEIEKNPGGGGGLQPYTS